VHEASKEMEETEGFGSALYQNLQEVLDWAASPENHTKEESLYQFNKIDELLILINKISLPEFNISIEDRDNLLEISNVFNELRKELLGYFQTNTNSNELTVLPTVFMSDDKPGRPKIVILPEVIEELRGLGFSWTQIAKILNVSRWTVRRRVDEYQLADLKRFTDITDDEVDAVIQDYISKHGPTTGERFISGLFRSKGITIQRRRIRESLNRVDPKKHCFEMGCSGVKKNILRPLGKFIVAFGWTPLPYSLETSYSRVYRWEIQES